ncbi:MAG: ribonuclease, partial [Clostridiales bacterium]|nr:ribonuclease [Clostridiales bacterium]
IGEHTRKIYRLGDKVRVKVAKVELSTRNIDFVIDEGE